jgi:ATP-dependent RNA helicase DHX8/PRP22
MYGMHCYVGYTQSYSVDCCLTLCRALATSQSVQIHPSSVLFRTKPDCIIFNELVRTTQNYVKNLTRIDPLWLAELAPQYYATED